MSDFQSGHEPEASRNEEEGGAGFLATRLRDLAASIRTGLRARSLTPFLAGHCGCRREAEDSCRRLCEEGATRAPAPTADADRSSAAGGVLRLEGLARNPRDADLLIVAGAVNERLGPWVQRVYQQMPEPKRVMAWGQCAVSGGLFEADGVLQGVDRILPVDVYVPGCPPSDEALRHALELLLAEGRPRRQRPGPEDADDPWRFGGPPVADGGA
jgi:Ni,Fe-hydrogenase III small subunit